MPQIPCCTCRLAGSVPGTSESPGSKRVCDGFQSQWSCEIVGMHGFPHNAGWNLLSFPNNPSVSLRNQSDTGRKLWYWQGRGAMEFATEAYNYNTTEAG